jgi:S-formylglutathione hydrolase
MDASIETRDAFQAFGGRVSFHVHPSKETGTPMRFGLYLPPQAETGPVPALYYLAGLTCTEETFLIKAGALRWAARLGLALVAPDTSPRGLDLPGIRDNWDFGEAAGFYLDATALPWKKNFRMYSYVTGELPALVEAHFPVVSDRRGIFGHSMGGHGALTIALKQPARWRSVSAFSPICNPVAVPWGEKAFSNYLGSDRAIWAQHDASLLMRKSPYPGPILVDQGEADKFLDSQLRPEALERAAAESGQRLTLRRHPGYDHSYWFIQSMIEDHLIWHAEKLAG